MKTIVSTLLLNPATALTLACAEVLLRASDRSWSWFLNPWGWDALRWFGAYACMRAAFFIAVDLLARAAIPRLPRLPSRKGGAPPPSDWQGLDVAFLALNSVVEFVFAQHLARRFGGGPLTTWRTLTALNGPFALWALFVADDLLYAPFHRLLHLKVAYRHVHRHHHKTTTPSRGYLDAANEHPVEMVGALALHWVALCALSNTVGVHLHAAAAHLVLKALGACFNHMEYDLRFSVLGIEYSAEAHEAHHRRSSVNYAQYVMGVDRLMGTRARDVGRTGASSDK